MSEKVLSPLPPNTMTTRIKAHYQHEGELFVQKRRHVPPDVPKMVSETVHDDMPDQHTEFFTHLSYFAIATIDSDGRPWATIIVGSPTTLIYAVSKIQLNVSVVLPEGDPFFSSVVNTVNATSRYFAGIGVDFSNRRRNKVAGFIASSNVVDNTLNMSLITNESLGNCPKYITVRKLEYCGRHPQIGADHQNADNISLNQECLDIISQASTIFLATRHISNVSDNTSDLGVNHRGGFPGFVRTYEENGNTYIVIPDYSGNQFYQSLGNIESDRLAGVVFPCFTTGDMLHVTGIAENIYDDEAERIMPRVTLITRIKLNGYVWIKEALNLKLLSPEQYSLYNPPVRYLAIELEKMKIPSKPATTNATLVDIKSITQHISRFTFELEEKVSFKPGGFVILNFEPLIKRAYQHMNNDNPQSLNDDHVRTWTISSSPAFDSNTNMFQTTNKVSYQETMASSLNKQHPWFEICHPRPTAKYQVFIFPAAGPTGSYYRDWDRDFPEYEFSIIIYPGRSTRFNDKLITDLKEYIEQLDEGLLPYINKPCFFIGHSLGCVISFALAKHMIDTKNKGNLIQLMVQMGRGPLHLKSSNKYYIDMTDAEIIEELKTIADPITRYIYDEPSYVKILLPMLRADSQVGKEVLPETPLMIPIIVYVGEKEASANEEYLNKWKELTMLKSLFRVRMFPGHHNFQAECGPQVLSCLKQDFNNIINILRMY
ncbi:unnamed protein product [Rotaria sordida]|uniref:oleoyl-[acyl-carrier-protein] hydrolase n=2 Tax=Rotaria sordida TaxID=392033 RepID=A0A815EH18_9BILA|nr:unnamed protein product [Rotaria sordida]CAF3882180.1 unnamed protein product [Rotaria sordida]